MKSVLLSLLLVPALAGMAQQVQPNPVPGARYTLEECLRQARRGNATLRIARREAEAAEERRREAYTNYFPQVSASGFAFRASKDMARMDVDATDVLAAVPEQLAAQLPAEVLAQLPSSYSLGLLRHGVVGSVSAVQPVFAGGQIVNGNRLARVGAAAQRLQAEWSEKDVDLATEQYYWQVVSLKEKLRTIDAVQTLLAQVEHDVSTAVAAGVTMRNDLLQVQLRANETRRTRIKVENALTVCKQLLAQHIGLAGETVDVADTIATTRQAEPASQPLRQDHQSALNATPEYRLLELGVRASELQHRLTVGRQLPTVGVGAAYTYNDLMGSGRHFGMVFATATIPISDWWGGSHAIRRQRLAVDNAREELRNSSELLVIGMDNAWNDLDDARSGLRLAALAIEQGEENLRLCHDSYRAGTAPMSDLLQAQLVYQQARDQYVDACVDCALAALRYRQATGAAALP